MRMYLVLPLLLLFACSTQAPALSPEQMAAAVSLPEKERLYERAKIKLGHLSGRFKEENQQRLQLLADQIANEYQQQMSAELKRNRVLQDLVRLETINQYENLMPKIRQYQKQIAINMAATLATERERSETYLQSLLEAFDAQDIEKIKQLKQSLKISHASASSHAKTTRLLGETQLNLMLNAQQAFENADYPQTLLYLSHAEAIEKNQDTEDLAKRAYAGQINFDIGRFIKRDDYVSAYNSLLAAAKTEQFASAKPFFTDSILRVPQFFADNARKSMAQNNYYETFNALMYVKEIDALINAEHLGEATQISLMERLYDASKRAAQKNRTGLELGLLYAMYSLDQQYPGLDTNMELATKRVLYQASGRIAVLPFSVEKAHQSLGNTMASSLVASLNDSLLSSYNAMFIDELSKLDQQRYDLDYYARGVVKETRIIIPDHYSVKYPKVPEQQPAKVARVSIVYELFDAKTQRKLAMNTLTAKTAVAEGANQKVVISDLLDELAVTIADQVKTQVRIPYDSYLNNANRRIDEGKELDAIESIAPLVVMGKNKSSVHQWLSVLVEKSLIQATKLGLR